MALIACKHSDVLAHLRQQKKDELLQHAGRHRMRRVVSVGRQSTVA